MILNTVLERFSLKLRTLPLPKMLLEDQILGGEEHEAHNQLLTWSGECGYKLTIGSLLPVAPTSRAFLT